MIGLYHHWSEAPLPTTLAGRFAASLGIGLAGGVRVRESGGATLASAVPDARLAKSWTPARAPDGTLSLFMGYIDNRADLIRALPGDTNPTCDNATLYGLCHAVWGEDCDQRIIGNYATILWSAERATIRLARSPIEAPALHIWKDADRIIIATAARPIFATGEVRKELDTLKIADSLFLNYKEEERGWFEGVARLPIGSRAIITQDRTTITRYYDAFAGKPVRFTRDEDYVEAADALFEQGTRAVLQGFSRPAVSVSGGYDSQAVAAYALRVLPQSARLLGLTSVPEAGWDGRTTPNRFGDEREHVKALAAMHPRMDTDFVDAADLGIDHKLDAMFLMAGTAPRNPSNLHWIHEIQSRAKAAGCDILLSGSMGNATFSFDGSGAFPGWFMNGHWAQLARELWASRGDYPSFGHAVASTVMMPLLPPRIANWIRKQRHGKTPDPFESWCPLNPEWAADMRVHERAAALGFDSSFTAMRSTRDWRAAVLGNAANEVGDVLNAVDTIGGVPTRDPTAYRPLLEYCFAIPDDQYIRGGERRWLAKRMLKTMVPDMVLAEKRRGLQAADWHLRLGRQRGQMIDELDQLATNPAMAAMLNLPRLRAALDKWPAQTPIDDGPASFTLQLALTRALSTARFIRYVEGTNG